MTFQSPTRSPKKQEFDDELPKCGPSLYCTSAKIASSHHLYSTQPEVGEWEKNYSDLGVFMQYSRVD